MVTEKLLVVVIVTPNSDRHVPLLKILKADDRFEIRTLAATMIGSDSDLYKSGVNFTQDFSKVFECRDLTNREIGCANSHNMARAMISENPLGGIILEDDARIVNSELFYEISTGFLRNHLGKPFVLSLTGLRFANRRNESLSSSACDVTMTLHGTPDLAVAYALTRASSRILLKANLPIRSVADWPESRCIFKAALIPVVAHGDADTKSTIAVIGPEFRKGITLKQKIRLLTFHTFKNSQNVTFQTYFKKVFINRITWHTDYLRYNFMLMLQKLKSK